MREEREYQKRMIDSKSKITICNWERGDGKTESIVYDILGKEVSLRPSNYYIVVNNRNQIDYVHKIFNADIDYEKFQIERVSTNFDNNKYGIKYQKSDVDIKINVVSINELQYEIRGINNIECIYFDECIPSIDDIKLINRYENCKVYIMMTKDINYIEHKKNEEKFDKNKEINKLIDEYINIPKRSNTTLYRESILKQIKEFKEIF